MPTPPLSDFQLQEALEAFERFDTKKEAAGHLGLSWSAFNNRLKHAQADPLIREAAAAGGIEDISTLLGGWKMVKDENGNGFSLRFKNADSGEDMSFTDMVKEAVDAAFADKPLKFEKRKVKTDGEYLLVIDLADVHFGKLCVTTETGYVYDRDVARHRVIEGTKSLLRAAKGFGVGRVLFILGNDALHTEDGKGTTAGTPQDSDGTFFQAYSTAYASLVESIEMCAKVADVDLIHCMSNHDWRSGWMLSQAIGARFEGSAEVNSTVYNLSESHRKYYGYGNNAFLVTHGDGTKEEKIVGHFMQEARGLASKCSNLYALLHHVHHKVRKKRGVDVFQTEKDHNGLTAVMTGAASVEGTHVDIEYVRSPSAPDGWHDRNGYVNRQGVECFLYHPQDGMKARFTEWF